jgi:hypothetical protein
MRKETMHADSSNQNAGRADWTAPELKRLDAGSAEAGADGADDDGFNQS